MAVGIKTIKTIQHRFPTTVLLMVFHALVMSHMEYSALCLLAQFKFDAFFGETDELGFELCFFLVSIHQRNEKTRKCNRRRQLMGLKTLTWFFLYIRIKEEAFQQQLELPTAS